MSVNTSFFEKHKTNKSEMNVFITSGNSKTMLTGKINEFDDTSFILDDCLIQIDKLISITPKR